MKKTNKKNSKPVCVLVLGMHRSGTSALTRALNLLGVDLPKQILPGSRGNEGGHWEPARLVALNDQMLAETGSSWDDWRAFDFSALSEDRRSFYREEIKRLLQEEYEGSQLFVVKDPRIGRFVPLITEALEGLGIDVRVIHAIRNPLSVMKSLKTRDDFSKQLGSILWLRHELDSENATRGMKRVFVFYENILSDWRQQIEKIEKTLKLKWPEAEKNGEPVSQGDPVVAKLGSHFTTRLQNHKARKEELLSEPNILSLVKRSYRAFQILEERPNDKRAMSDLDGIRTEFTAAIKTFDDVIGKSERQVYQPKIDSLNNEIERLNAEIGKLVDGHKQKLKKLQTEAEKNEQNYQEKIATLFEDVAALRKQIKQRRQELKESSEQQQALADENSLLSATIAQKDSELLIAEGTNRELSESLSDLVGELNAEKYTVIRPLYRNFFRFGGRVFRKFMPGHTVDRIRRYFPNPDGVPPELTYRSPEEGAGEAVNVEVTAPTSEPDVFVLSIIDWDFRTQRPQHIARGLSKNHRVFYIEMLLEASGHVVQDIADNLYKVRLARADIGHIQPYSGRIKREQIDKWIKVFLKFCNEVNATSFKQIVIQHPFWWQVAQHLPPEFEIVFDCMDDIGGFSNTTPQMVSLEKDMLSKCNKLVVSSQYLFDKYKGFKEPVMIRNAGQVDLFAPSAANEKAPAFLPALSAHHQEKKIRVGYVGAIAEWFDVRLIRETATAHPEMEFHFCGGITAPEPAKLQQLPNVFLHGEIPYTDVPAFIRQMDVMTIPFKLLPIIQACDPVKFYEHSAMGKPTVSTKLPELKRAKNLVFFASGAHEFGKQIAKAAEKGRDKKFQADLREYAMDNTWIHRSNQFEEVLASHPSVSVVILSYGEPGWTKATLLSLFEGGATYPNMEVIVVDNGSSPEALEEIRSITDGLSNCRVIENGENLGFAKGNNVGLKAAKGKYVMLLNNDTYVAPGAIYAMVKHLERNPEIGVVGPLTNNIGNEARISVNYNDMNEMKNVAREATIGYRGRHTQIRVNAYFAVMFRKADLKKFGYLSTEFGRGMFEDDDHCEMIRSKGYVCALAEDAFIHHHLSATFSQLPGSEKQELFDRNKEIFEKKWGPWKPHEYRKKRPVNAIWAKNE